MYRFPLCIVYPFFDAYAFRQVRVDTNVPFEYSNSLFFTSSILFGFTSLIIVSKEWIDQRIWAILLPHLVLIVLSGVAIGNLAFVNTNSVDVPLYSSAAFNANVVSTGFIVGYVTQELEKQQNQINNAKTVDKIRTLSGCLGFCKVIFNAKTSLSQLSSFLSWMMIPRVSRASPL